MVRTEHQREAVQKKLKQDMKDIGSLPVKKRDAAALVAIAVASADLGNEVTLDMIQEPDGRVVSYNLRNKTDEKAIKEARMRRERLRRR